MIDPIVNEIIKILDYYIFYFSYQNGNTSFHFKDSYFEKELKITIGRKKKRDFVLRSLKDGKELQKGVFENFDELKKSLLN